MFKCFLFSLLMDRVPGIVYPKATDSARGKRAVLFCCCCSDNLQLFLIANIQILPSIKFSQVHKLSDKATKYKETQDLARERNEG